MGTVQSKNVAMITIGRTTNGGEEIAHRSPQEIMEEIAVLDAESAKMLGNIGALL